MSSENVGTVKAHGLKVGDRFNFHGMGSDIPTVEGTRVVLGKVGNLYMLTSVLGEVMTWEFGATAKIWADTSVEHAVITESRVNSHGDTVWTAECEHGWMTGLHNTEDDARAVALGHGEVKRPLYVPAKPVDDMTETEILDAVIGDTASRDARDLIKHGDIDASDIAESNAQAWCEAGSPRDDQGRPVILADAVTLAVGDVVVVNGTGLVGMVEARYSDGTVNVFGLEVRKSLGVFYPVALTVVTDEAVSDAKTMIQQNGKIYASEVGNFGGTDVFRVLVLHGWVTLVEDGPYSRYVRTRYTADRVKITDGLPVWDYDLAVGRVVLSSMDGDGWFDVKRDSGDRSLMNGERVRTRHPYTGQSAAEALAQTSTEDAWVSTIAEHDALKASQEATRMASRVQVDPVPSEVEIWAGTNTMITYPLRRPVATKLAKRSRKSARRARRGIKGGF